MYCAYSWQFDVCPKALFDVNPEAPGDDPIESHNEHFVGGNIQAITSEDSLDATRQAECLASTRASFDSNSCGVRVYEGQRLRPLYTVIPRGQWNGNARHRHRLTLGRVRVLPVRMFSANHIIAPVNLHLG